MDRAKDVLFEPLELGRLRLTGRLYKSATAETRASEDGYVTDQLLEFYEPIARAGTPLIITGNIYVDRQGRSVPRMCGADHDDKIPGLRRWADLTHGHGSALFAQLNHCGRQVLPKTVGIERAVSASHVREKFIGTKPRPLTVVEIENLVNRFAEAAERCRRASFDGVQIHAAHGYLISQFLTPYTNRRADAYGGSVTGRTKLLLDVYRAIRVRCGEDYPIVLKINGADLLPGRKGLATSELVEVARLLQEEGVDGVEVSSGHYESLGAMMRGRFDSFYRGLLSEGVGRDLPWLRRTGLRLLRPVLGAAANRIWPVYEGYNLEWAAQFKKRLRIPVICVGGFRSREGMSAAIRDGHCDAVSSARSMIADPYLYKHLREGTRGPQCDFCNACIARAGRLPLDCYNPDVRVPGR